MNKLAKFGSYTLFSLVALGSVAAHADIERKVKGKYTCDLIFNFTNNGNSSITRTDAYTKRTLISSNAFYQNTFGNKVSSDRKTDIGMDIHYQLSSVRGTMNSALHTEVANTLTSRSSSSREVNEEEKVSVQYTVNPHSTLKLYRTVYTTNGVTIYTDSVTTDKADCSGEVEFTYVIAGACLYTKFSQPGSKPHDGYYFLNRPRYGETREDIFKGSHAGALIGGVMLNRHGRYTAFVDWENDKINYGHWEKHGESKVDQTLDSDWGPTTYTMIAKEVNSSYCDS